MKKISLIIPFLLVILLAAKAYKHFELNQIHQANQTTVETARQNPEQSYLEVPFICQAPLETEANWVFHEESCEEAALLQAYNYLTNTETTKQQSHEIILDMIAWQEENMNSHHDLYDDEMKQFITGYYNLPESAVQIIPNATIEDIEQSIATGTPVIAGLSGEILNNPYYPYPGYHMLLITGYTADKFITNDNGTRRGKDFSYDKETFMQALKASGGSIIILTL